MPQDYSALEFTDTLLRQYNDATSLQEMISLEWQSISMNDFVDDFYNNIWNIATANSYGLDVWGKIIDLSRTMQYTASGLYFGFREAKISETTSNDPQPWNAYPFYSKNYSNTTGTVVLSDDLFRKALMMKAFHNITNMTIPAMNSSLVSLFGDSGNAWVSRDGPNAMSYRFDFTPSATELAIIQNSKILPVPAGAVVSYIIEEST